MDRIRNSNLTASAQPMSHPLDFQPGSRCQVHHLFPIVIPILKPELASEKACRSVMGAGPGMAVERVAD